MIEILRAAYDRGITFFDCAEAYGPWENERILGEAIQPFRNKVRITFKYGWNIDQQTGRRLPGLNSKPDHIKLVVEGSLKRLRTDRIDLLYQHRVDPEVMQHMVENSGAAGVRFTPSEISELNSALRPIEVKGQPCRPPCLSSQVLRLR
jgi:predicted oxidoreductase